MADWDDVRRIALGMPEAEEKLAHGQPSWRIRDKILVYLEELGE